MMGKKFSMNERALRLITVEILRGYVDNVKDYEDMIDYLNNLGERSRLAEHWINKPVLIMMMYVRAEHEGELKLHLHACELMMMYYFAASHWNYARELYSYGEKAPNEGF